MVLTPTNNQTEILFTKTCVSVVLLFYTTQSNISADVCVKNPTVFKMLFGLSGIQKHFQPARELLYFEMNVNIVMHHRPDHRPFRGFDRLCHIG